MQVGAIIDETGTLAPGKLLWSPPAWQQLLGRTVEEVAASSTELLKYLERRLVFLRITIVFGWAKEAVTGGRLAVLGVKM